MISYVPEYALWRRECWRLRQDVEKTSQKINRLASGLFHQIEKDIKGARV
jgi:hypothetical protein